MTLKPTLTLTVSNSVPAVRQRLILYTSPRYSRAFGFQRCLDSTTGGDIMKLFLRLRESGLTIFMVTHDSSIASHAGRIVTMRDGVLVSIQPTTEVSSC